MGMNDLVHRVPRAEGSDFLFQAVRAAVDQHAVDQIDVDLEGGAQHGYGTVEDFDALIFLGAHIR